jgi:hypothetical protein
MNLTDDQIRAILNLEKNPLVSKSGLAMEDGSLLVNIESVIDAKRLEVDWLLIKELGELMAELEHMGTPATFHNPFSQLDEEINFLNYQGETLIRLVMRKSPKPLEKWSTEDVMDREG